jgi:phthalate 4,5-dioxygenase
MLTQEKNDLITQTGPGTPGGTMMRRYWQPVALSAELAADVPLPLRLLGEDLVAFRDAKGAPALIGRRCPHRGVDLSYGRVEGGGLRCIYHGWLFSGEGRCLEQPGEPAASTYKDEIRPTAYPCREAGGIVFAYLGPGKPPRLSSFPFFAAEPAQRWVTKIHHDCNYLQASEGNVDPQHLSYLHRFIAPGAAVNSRLNSLLIDDPAPRLEFDETPFGMRIFAARAVGLEKRYVRITNFIMPNCSAFDGNPLTDPRRGPLIPNIGYQMHWHVPIDDATHWKYIVMYRHDGGPVDREFQEKTVLGHLSPDYELPRNAANRYLQDRAEMRQTSFAGLGRCFFDHDKFAVEAQGPVVDRTREHLGTTDRAVVVMRRQLLDAIADVAADRDPLFVERDGQGDALAEMVVCSKEVAEDADLHGGWWR